ncbi:MAG: hypothetical protein JSV04_12830 [Candidatus Heimdallarchaeota archaeon]|nr:MAG: hypothetical protein JSV04_12830 [Candidatus Heimdallarchaeota archaeon]
MVTHLRTEAKTIVLGQMVLDTVIYNHQNTTRFKNQNNLMIGGPPTFAGIIGLILSKIYPWMPAPLIYAYACPKIVSLMSDFSDQSIIVKNLKVLSKCPQFRLIYSSEPEERTLFLKNPPMRFDPTIFNWKLGYSPVVVMGSVYHEFNDQKIFSFLREKCSFIAFDAQGCFRQLTSEGRIILEKWWDSHIIDKVDCLKISEAESKFLNVGTNLLTIVKKILETQVTFVLITRGKNGSILGFKDLNKGKVHLYNVPAFTEGAIVDETGAGDVFLYAFVARLTKFNNELDAIAFATSVASLLIEEERFLKKFNQDEIQRRQKKISSQIIEI